MKKLTYVFVAIIFIAVCGLSLKPLEVLASGCDTTVIIVDKITITMGPYSPVDFTVNFQKGLPYLNGTLPTINSSIVSLYTSNPANLAYGLSSVTANSVYNVVIALANTLKMQNPNATEWDVKFSIPACWQTTTTQFVPCISPYCCSGTYKVEKAPYDPLKLIIVQFVPDPGNVNCSWPCGSVCDVLPQVPDVEPAQGFNDCSNTDCIPPVAWSNLKSDTYVTYLTGSSISCRVYYNSRDCNGIKEFNIQKVEILTTVQLSTEILKQAENQAIKHLIHFLESEFGTINFPVTVHVSIPKCWQTIFIEPEEGDGNLQETAACPGECCEIEYSNITKNPTTGNLELSGYSTLIKQSGTTCIEPCNINMCEQSVWYIQHGSAILGKMGINEKGLGNEIINEDFNKSYVIPNPATNETRIVLNSTEKGLTKLNIYDYSGKEIFTMSIDKNSFESEFKFNAGNFTNGIYSYTITINDKQIISNKFVIYR